MARDRAEILSPTPPGPFPPEPTFPYAMLPRSAAARDNGEVKSTAEDDGSECKHCDKNDEWAPEEDSEGWFVQTSWLPDTAPKPTSEDGSEVPSTTRLPESTPAATGIEIQTVSIPKNAPEYTNILTLSIVSGKHSKTGASVMIHPTTSTTIGTSSETSSGTTTSTTSNPTAGTTTGTTAGKPSVTIGIPDFVSEFTTELSYQSMMGKHSPTGLPTPLPLTYINPSAGVSVVPTHGPTVSFAPNGHVSMIESSSPTETETTTTAAASTAIVPGKKIKTTTSHTHKAKVHPSTKTRASHTPKPHPHHTTTKTKSNYTKTKTHSTHTKTKTHSTHTKANSHSTHTKKPTHTLEPRGQDYKLPGCTLSSSSFTATTTSLAPSTLIRLSRRSPGHYIDQGALRVLDVRPVEISLGTKDSANNILYDESTAATPWKPWGAPSGSGLVYDSSSRVPKLLPVVVGIVFGVLVVVLGSWITIRVMLNTRAKNRAVAFRKEMDTEQIIKH